MSINKTVEERRQQCEDFVAQAAAREAITPDDQVRFDALLQEFPALRREHDELSHMIAFIHQHSLPERTENERRRLENQVVERVRKQQVRGRASAAGNIVGNVVENVVGNVVGYVRLYGFRAIGAAAVFVCGVAIGRWSWFMPANSSAEHSESTEVIARATSSETSGNEAQTFLRDAHLLMLGVMAMNAECGVANPRTFAAQRERCVELMARAERVNRSLQTPVWQENTRQSGERLRLVRLVGEIEFALADLASVQPTEMNSTVIRQMQQRTDYALCEVSSALGKK
jgi:hypothetical protein